MRFVEERPTMQPFAVNGSSGLKDGLARVGKYVPAEVLAFYLSVAGLGRGLTVLADFKDIIEITLYALSVVAIPFYVWRSTSKTNERWTNSIVAVVAFFVWTYGIHQGLASQWPYDPVVASVLLAVFSFVTGFIVPPSQKKKPAVPQ